MFNNKVKTRKIEPIYKIYAINLLKIILRIDKGPVRILYNALRVKDLWHWVIFSNSNKLELNMLT